jgi:hypothetical protein
MSELKTRFIDDTYVEYYNTGKHELAQIYLKSEADKVIAEKDAEICRLKNGIAPKYSDKTLQERLNEVCEKHGVSTLQDLDWAFCESEKRHTKDNIEAEKEIEHHKYKRCLAMSKWCKAQMVRYINSCDRYDSNYVNKKIGHYHKWIYKWMELAEKFKEAK